MGSVDMPEARRRECLADGVRALKDLLEQFIGEDARQLLLEQATSITTPTGPAVSCPSQSQPSPRFSAVGDAALRAPVRPGPNGLRRGMPSIPEDVVVAD